MRALKGAGVGLLLAVVFLAIGAIRAIIALLSGRHMIPVTGHDLTIALFYVGGFTVAGALIGFLLPRLSSRFGTYVAFSLGGVIVMLAIALGDKGSFATLDGTDLVFLLLMGTGLGSAAAYGYTRQTS